MKKILAIILSASIILTELPISVHAETTSDQMPVTAEQTATVPEKNTSSSEEPYIISELTEKRDATTKYFAMSDGTIKACIYPQNVHYLADGQYEEIDNTLIETSDGGKSYYTNKRNSFSVKLPESFTDDYIEFSDDNGYVKFKLSGAANKKLEKEAKSKAHDDMDLTVAKNVNDRATFKSVKGDVDIEYDLSGNKLKETLVLYKKTKKPFLFDIKTSAASAAKNNDNSISFYDAGGVEIYTIAGPYMTDAAGEYSNSVETTLTTSADGYTLAYTPDYEWLSAKERTYPVRIDPTLVQAIYTDTVADTYVSNVQNSRNPDIRGGWDVINIGRRTATVDGSQVIKRGLIKFDIPGEIGKNDCIVDARLDLVHYTETATVSVNGIQIDVHELTSAFSEGGTWWGNQPSYDPVITDYAIVNRNHTFAGSSLSYDSYNITRLVSKWHTGSPNYGIMLKLHDEGTAVTSSRQVYYFARQSVYYHSVSKFIEITYRNCVGLEDYWSYTVQEAGERGNAYVNNFNGNLTYIHNDVAFNSGITGFTLAHVYNSAEAKSTSEYNSTIVKYGNGWRLNLIQTLVPANVSGNSSVKYIYTDGDGTEHYFVQLDDGSVVDEDGLGYTFSRNEGDAYPNKITAKDKTVMSFDSAGFLRTIRDSNGNSINMNYSLTSSGTNYLTGITTSSGGSISLNYDSSYTLTSVTDNSGRMTTFLYSEGFLKHIYYPDGLSTHFAYDVGASNAMTVLHHSYDRYNNYRYDGNRRVNSVQLNGNAGAAGVSYTFDYDHHQTKITDNRNRSITYQFDTVGRPTCAYDSEGNAVSQSYTAGSTASGNIFKNNKVSLSSDNIKYIDNLYHNGGFSHGLTDSTTYSYGSTAASEFVTDVSYLTQKSIKLSVNEYGWSTVLQYFSALDSPVYTASAYVRMENVESVSGGAAIEICTSNSRYIHSDFLTGSTDTEVDDGFRKITLTLSLEPGESVVHVGVGLFNAKGTVYVDSIQLEEGDTSNTINLLSNSGFEKNNISGTSPSYFTACTDGAVSSAASFYGSRAFGINGSVGNNAESSQTVYFNGKAGDTYSFGSWAMADAVPHHEGNESGLKIVAQIKNLDGTIQREVAEFNEFVSGWQFSAKAVIAEKPHYAITISLCYSHNCNTAYFDSLFLYRDTAQSYTYDSRGNVIATKDNASQQSSFEYDGNNNLKKLLEPTGVSYEYTYDSKNNLTEANTSNGVKYNITYDSYGNPLSSVTSSTDTGMDKTVTSSATYQDNGNYLHTMTDSRGNTTTYAYNLAKGLQTVVTDAKGGSIGYAYYENSDRLNSVAAGDCSTSYQYEYFGGLNKITAPSGTEYNFTYDKFWNTKAVSVGTQKLTENFYNANNGPLAYSVYGNGAKIGYQYDILDRVTEKLYNDVVKVKFKYNRFGCLYEKQDLFTNTNYRYDYDLSGRVLGVTASNGISSNYTYDEFNRVSKLITKIGENTNKTEYIYGDAAVSGQKTGLIYGIKQNGTQRIGYSYDGLGRLVSRTLSTTVPFVTEYGYLEGASANTTTMLVKTVKNGNDTLEYAYDAIGNITSVKKNGTVIESYAYDSLNQLTSASYGGDTYTYTYDNGGNLLSVKKNGTETRSYGYTDTNWKDKLTSYNGQQITYDAIGNPLSYRDGMGFTWQNGRQLSGITIAREDNTSDSISYNYNSDGLRTAKTVNGTTTEYYWLEGTLLGQRTGDEYLTFLYDENGSAYGFLLRNGTAEAIYYYEFNLQGDVIGIIDGSGSKVVEYTYGAWGDILSVTGTMAGTIGQKNPLRYRGYYYDAETGFYYVSSRYYDPEIGRWINADIPETLTADFENFAQYNLFAYCFNNPVNMSDETGTWPSWAKKVVAAVAVVAVVAAVAAVTVATAGAGTAVAVIAVGAAKGAAIGIASGATIGAATGAVSHRVSTGSWSGASTAALNGMGDGALSGAVTGAITGAAGSAIKVSQAAKAWDSGTFKSGYQSMKYHYNKHVVSEGLTKGNNVLKYTQDAVGFANRNSSVLKYTYNYNYRNASWNLTYSTGKGGMFTSGGKILTFWYR